MTGEEIARELGIHYDGYQKGIGMQFTDIQQTETTFYADTLEDARTRFTAVRKLWAKAGPACSRCGFGKAYQCKECKEWFCDFCSPDIERLGLCQGCRGKGLDATATARARHDAQERGARPEEWKSEEEKREVERWHRMREVEETGNPTVPTGTCYPDAWRFLVQKGEGFLIHGSIQLSAEGPRVNHAWVELLSGWIWEPQTGSYYLIKDFGMFQPIEEIRYTVEEATIMVARVGQHGTWSAEERVKYIGR